MFIFITTVEKCGPLKNLKVLFENYNRLYTWLGMFLNANFIIILSANFSVVFEKLQNQKPDNTTLFREKSIEYVTNHRLKDILSFPKGCSS